MFKSLDPARDIVNQLSAINEVVTVTSTYFSDTGEPTVKRFSHWTSGSVSGSFYHAIFNTSSNSATAVEIADITVGYSNSSSFYISGAILSSKPASNISQKNRIYRLFAKKLLGSETEFFTFNSTPVHELIFLTIRRSQYKDEIKKGTVGIETQFSGNWNINKVSSYHYDTNASNVFSRTQYGDVANLYTGSNVSGKVYYNAGVIAMIPDKVNNTGSWNGNSWSGSLDFGQVLASSAFDNMLDGARYKMRNLSFVAQTNLHSSFYFCRALNDEFNYSSNPTFVDSAGRIITTSSSVNLTTRTYITKVGLLGENNELLAIASLSKPLKKSPDTELVIKVRLDY